MKDLYSELKKKSGQNCYTLSQNKPARMVVDDAMVTIVYPTGNALEIPRAMIAEAIRQLRVKGILTLEDVHETITHRHGPTTDRLMAVLRELPGVTHTARPRALQMRETTGK